MAGMKIIAVTDLHEKTSLLPALSVPLKEADLVILCGDITHFGRKKEMELIIRQFRQYNPSVLAVTGNCDYPVTEQYLEEEGISLHGSVREFGEYLVVGLSGSLPCPGTTPHEYSEEAYAALLENIPLPDVRTLILVSHQPPFNTLNDRVSPGVHVGSKIIRRFIEQHQPLVCFTGHIHEGIAIDHIGKTAVVNPGPARAGNYALAELEGPVVKILQLRNLFTEKVL
jgi:uncharacterized protein